jgi:hypothetical protein
MHSLNLFPLVTESLGLLHPEHYRVSNKWLASWNNDQEPSLARLRVLSSPDDLLYLPPLDPEVVVHLGMTLCRIVILSGPPRTGKTEWLQKRLRLILHERPHL